MYDFAEGELNGLGYTLLGMSDVSGAIRVFELNAQQYPESSNVFDSLGEAYLKANRRATTRGKRAYAAEVLHSSSTLPTRTRRTRPSRKLK